MKPPGTLVKLIKASGFGLFMLLMNFGYAICDRDDDEFWKSSWALKLYVWCFEHTVWVVERWVFWPAGKLFGLLHKHSPDQAIAWLDTLYFPVMITAGFLFWAAFAYFVIKRGNVAVRRAFYAIWAMMSAGSVALFAIDASIPFTEWTFDVEYRDHTGWAERFPDRAACERKLKEWEQSPEGLAAAHGPQAPVKARCISPTEE
jgi:hypothetical protein